ncbi:uncharacterized protein LOC133515089 [Syngnathoides biaculeatus]|uniref:uncharacterized protein LOC133515089 n=1 Tax=Syngnathoides biaculeatus TaxID=300417 RepID=UPI002ADE5B88|nr:uncharacterized protein LOC133515089 [Syngnathoides biaculeatus]
MTLRTLFCGCLVFLLNDCSSGFSVKKLYGGGQTLHAQNPLPVENLNWDLGNVRQPDSAAPNARGYFAPPGPRSAHEYPASTPGQPPRRYYPAPGRSNAAQSDRGHRNHQNRVRNEFSFGRANQVHRDRSSVLNDPPFSGVWPAYPSDAGWPFDSPRRPLPRGPVKLPRDSEELEPEESPTYIVRSRNGHERASFLFTKAFYTPRVAHPLAGHPRYYYAKKRHAAVH